ncbi:MAG: hypothetical protein DMG35_00835 [Acidobacteria bacterium]|nr:MAG: hypothetical protein DMG35_00835 [Acidobacteriota bacterium]
MPSRKGRAGHKRQRTAPPFVPVSDDQIITTEQLSRWFPFQKITFKIFRLRNEGPPYIRVNRSIFYRVGDVRAWMAGKTVRPAE